MKEGKPPNLPLPSRPRAYAMEIPVGGQPVIDPVVAGQLKLLNNGVVREIQQTFPPPRGKALWGAPDVTALLIMIGAALERAAKYGMLAVEESHRREAVRRIAETMPKRTTISNPQWDDDAPTEPMRRRRKPDMGDE